MDVVQVEPTTSLTSNQEIFLGCMVEVTSRTWPGINRPGGVGRVTKCHYSTDGSGQLSHVDVRYVVMGGMERRVALEYCKRAPQFEAHVSETTEVPALNNENNLQKRIHLRDRSLMLGRCKKCGSLRMDCGSCDWIDEQNRDMDMETKTRDKSRSRKRDQRNDDSADSSSSGHSTRNHYTANEPLDDHYDSSSSDDDLLKRISRAYSKLNLLKKRRRRAVGLRKFHHMDGALSSLEAIGGSTNLIISLNNGSKHTGARSRPVPTADEEDRPMPRKVNNPNPNKRIPSFEPDSSKPRKILNSRPVSLNDQRTSKANDQNRTVNSELDSGSDESGDGRQEQARKVGVVHDSDIGDDDEDDEEDRPLHYYHDSRGESDSYSDSFYDSEEWENGSDISDQDDDFIQPEGTEAANYLPKDIIDQTEGFSLEEIVNFYRSMTKRLQDELIVAARQRLSFFQTKLAELKSVIMDSQSELTQQALQNCFDFYEDTCKALVINGIDQCRLALRKIRKRDSSEFSRVVSATDTDAMDCTFDVLQSQVDELLRNVRLLLTQFQTMVESEESELNDDESLRTKHRKGVKAWKNVVLPSNDPHPFASRKHLRRQNRSVGIGMKRKQGKLVKAIDFTVARSICSEHDGVARQRSPNDRNFDQSSGERSPLLPIINATRSDIPSHSRVSGNALDYTAMRIKSSIFPKGGGDMNRQDRAQNEVAFYMRDAKCNLPFEESHKLDPDEPLSTCHNRFSFQSVDFQNVCDSLVRQFSVQSIRVDILSFLPSYFRAMREKNIDIADSSKLVFYTLISLLQENGSTSFSEIVLINQKKLVPILQLYSCLFHLSAINIDVHLEERDGIAFRMMRFKKQETIEVCLLQIIDVLYSQILPDEYGCPYPLRPIVVQELSLLIEAISFHTPLVETISKLLMVKFGCQCWYHAIHADHKLEYVSSIDPSNLRSFLSDEGSVSLSSESRFEKLRGVLSRKEIDAVWMLLSFFRANSVQFLEATSLFRWRLLVTLFESPAGIFACNTPITDLIQLTGPPSEAHLKACLRELRHFCSMLSQSALDPLQSDNSILIRILSGCIRLEYRRFSIQNSALMIYGHSDIHSRHRRSVIQMWKESEINYAGDFQNASKRLKSTVIDFESFALKDHPYDILSLAPQSRLLCAILHIIRLWILRLPDKRARWLRFNDSIHVMIKICEEMDRKCFVNDGDDFSRTFHESKSSLSNRLAPAFLRESVGSLLLCVSQTKLERMSAPLPVQEATPLMANIDSLFCKEIWTRVATPEMIVSQDMLNSQMIYKKSSSVSYIEAFAAFKVMTSLTIIHIRSMTSCVPDINIVQFLISCILTSFGTIFESCLIHLPDSEASCFAKIVFHSSYWLNAIINALKFEKMITQIDFWDRLFSMIVPVSQEAISNMLCLSDPGKAVDLSFRCCISTIRSTLSALYNNSTECNIVRKAAALTSPGPDIDDAALMSIDMDALYREKDRSSRQLEQYPNSMFNFFVDHSIAAQSLFKFLLSLLANSVPSRRFALYDSTRTDHMNHTALGRGVVTRQSGAVAATLALLTSSVNNARSIVLNAELFLPQENLIGPYRGETPKEDCSYLRKIGTAYVVELGHLAQHSNPCLQLIQSNYHIVLDCVLHAIMDAETLACFPITDSTTLFIFGDDDCVRREKDRRESMLKLMNESVDTINGDIEALGINKLKGEMHDYPGPTFMSKHLWSLCKDIGSTFLYDCSDLYRSQTELKATGAALIQEITDSSSDNLKNLPIISLERECTRRFLIVRNIINAIFVTGEAFSRSADSISSCLKLFQHMLRQTESVKAALNYLGRNEEDCKAYDAAKAHVLFNEYGALCLVLLSWVLVQSRLCGGPYIELSELIWAQVLSITDRDRPTRLNIFHLLKDVYYFKSERTDSISIGVLHFLSALILYFEADPYLSFTDRNSNFIAESCFLHICPMDFVYLFKDNIFEELLTLSGGNQHFADHLIHQELLFRKSSNGFNDKFILATDRFRSVMSSWVLTKLKNVNSTLDEKEKVLAVLRQPLYLDYIIDVAGRDHLETGTDLKYLCEVMFTLCSLLMASIIQCHDDLVEDIYYTFITLMKKNVKVVGTEKVAVSLLRWPSDSEHVSYVKESFDWIRIISLLILQASPEDSGRNLLNCFHAVTAGVERKYDYLDSYAGMDLWLESNDKKINLEDVLKLRLSHTSSQAKTKNPYNKVILEPDGFLGNKTVQAAKFFLSEYNGL